MTTLLQISSLSILILLEQYVSSFDPIGEVEKKLFGEKERYLFKNPRNNYVLTKKKRRRFLKQKQHLWIGSTGGIVSVGKESISLQAISILWF